MALDLVHDLNNILLGVGGCTDLIRDKTAEDDPIREYLAILSRVRDRAALLTAELYRFTGREDRAELTSLNNLISPVERKLRQLAGENIELTFQMQPDLGLVKIDRAQIASGIMAIIGLARKITPNGGMISLTTQNVSSGNHVLLSVTDGGLAMSDSAVERLFREYPPYRGSELAELGAYLDRIGGEIRVVSEPERGATFEIYLPTCPEVPETILVVDDMPDVRHLVVHALRNRCYNVIEASDGREAVAAAGAHNGTIHLLLADMSMPGLSAEQMMEAVKRIRPDIRVLWMTAYTEAEVQERIPGALVMRKPFMPDQLLQKVREVLAAAAPR